MKAKFNIFAILFVLSIASHAFAQVQWQEDGVSIRQGTHLGWNGSMISVGDDVAMFYYHAHRDGTRDIYGQRIRPDGSYAWDSGGLLISGDVSEQRAPVAKTYSDGSILVVWEDYRNDRYRDLYAQRYSANGTPMWTPAEGVAVVIAPKDQFGIKLDINDDDYAFIAFTDDRGTTGADIELGAYAQIISPNGTLVHALTGLKLIDRIEFFNQAVDIFCHEHAAYILCTVGTGTGTEVVLQRIYEDGSLDWPEDSALFVTADYGTVQLAEVPGGMAIAWSDRTNDIYGDARLILLDYDRNPFPGWPANGNLIFGGDETQFIHRIDPTPNNQLLLSVFHRDLNSDYFCNVSRWDLDGNVVGSAVDFGLVALETSPMDVCWDNDEAIVSWVTRDEFYNHTVRVQKLSPQNIFQWSNDGNEILHAEAKVLRADIEKAGDNPVRLALLVGRSIEQPETLWVGELNNDGNLSEPAQYFEGGITYDILDPFVDRLGGGRLGVIWSDSRRSTDRDIYFQIIDDQGHSVLEPQGLKLNSDNLTIQFPPTLTADSDDGAYVAWTGDSLGLTSILKVQHLDRDGSLIWSRQIASANGFHDKIHLKVDQDHGLYVAYSSFSTGFVTRPFVMHYDQNGFPEWQNPVEFAGMPGTDLTIQTVTVDSINLILACESGPWTNHDITVFSTWGWPLEGLTFGTPNQERNPKLITLEDGILLTYESESDNGTYDVMGVLIDREGDLVWPDSPIQLTPPQATAISHELCRESQGGFIIAWEDYRNGMYARPFAARFNRFGIPVWQDTEALVCSDDREVTGVTLARDNNGGAWVMWEDYRNSGEYPEIDLYATHLSGDDGTPVTENGFTWPADGYPICDLATYQREPKLLSWSDGSAIAVWIDLRSSNPGRCCGAGAVGDLFQNIYAQRLSEFPLSADHPDISVPQNFGITSIYPNPFNPETTIQFSLAKTAFVELSIYNVLGQKTETLLSEQLAVGVHEITFNATNFSSGIYFAKLTTSLGETNVKKMVVMK